MRTSLFLLLVTLNCGLSAGVYRWQDADGVTHYADRPVEDAEQISVKGAGRDADSDEKKVAPGPSENPLSDNEILSGGEYSAFQLVEPEQNQTFRTDTGDVNIAILLEPALAQEHEIQLVVDGRPVKGSFSSTQLMLSAVGRGSHTLQARIIDGAGEIIAVSKVVNFHVRKAPLSGNTSEPVLNN